MKLKRSIALIVRKAPMILFAVGIGAMLGGFHNAMSEPDSVGMELFAFRYGYIPAVVVPLVALGLMLYIPLPRYAFFSFLDSPLS